jgi:hypothetical protein
MATARAHTEAILASYVGLLRHGLVGRNKAKSQVEAFMDAPHKTDNRTVPVLTLTGIGGVGKSTLLAEILRPRLTALLNGAGASPIVIIDLDRLAFRPHAEAELSYEVSRQLEVAWPELAGGMAAARAAETVSRLERREFAAGASSDVETSSRSSSSFKWRIQELIAGSTRRVEPVTLILDTFEEWQRARSFAGPSSSWNSPESVMAEWLRGLRDHMGLEGLRVVVSGRAQFDSMPGEEIELGDLETESATELLVRLGVERGAASRLEAIVGGNPLSLHVAARFVRKLTTEDRESFLSGDRLDAALDEDLRRAVLYDRFLNHIGDDDVKRLAHPGLLIRRVTPQVIREVLAEPCGFVNMSNEQSERLFERLADEVWLVRRAEDGSLRHQPEVRRPMVAMMSRDPKMRARARDIHERAARWYNRQPDLMEQPSMATVEAFYHRMMLSAGEPPIVGQGSVSGRSSAEQDHHTRFAWELGESVTEMAPAVEAQLRLLRGERLTPELAELLPDTLWERHVAVAGASLVELDEAGAAVDLFLKRPMSGFTDPPEWLAQAFSDSARWDEYAAAAATWNLIPAGRHDFVNLIVAGDESARERLLLRDVSASTDTDGGFLRAFMVALGRVQARREPKVNPPATSQPMDASSLAFPVDQLRQFIVHVLTGAPLPWPGGTTPAFPDIAGLLVPDSRVMEAFNSLTADTGFDRIAGQLEDLAHRANSQRPDSKEMVRSHDVLGTLAAQVAKTRFVVSASPDAVIIPAAFAALRGDNPELRPAIRHVLQTVAPNDEWLKTLGSIATSLLPVPVLDLRPDALPLLSEPDSRKALVTLVEYVDRSRVMRQFLHSAQEQHPQPNRLDIIVRAFDRWDDAHKLLLDQLKPSLPFITNVLPDVFDKRDLEYRPRLQLLPDSLDERPSEHFVLTQQGSSCTGHAVASMINTVLAKKPNPIRVSPYMIYNLARRYDEFPGNADEGSSLRGALKGWYYHGVLPEEDWPSLKDDPPIDLDPVLALKALRHPLGAFYRVNAFRIDDMQSAVNELHAVVASARIHSGWIEPQAEQRGDGTTHYIIRRSTVVDQLGGHAFAIVGYNDVGFLIQNSWGPTWGRKGFATLPYEDWLVSAYDAWVARPGVPNAVDLRKNTKVVTATTGGVAQGPGPDLERLRNHVVNLGNNGLLSGSGRFVSTCGQINKIFENMEATHSEWTSRHNLSHQAPPRRIVLYAHGGLVDENAGLRTAQGQLNWWLNNEVYPITFAWQSGPIETFLSQLEDITKDLIPFGGLGFDLVEQADRLVEKVARSRLRWMWDEMKENAEKSSSALPHQVLWRPTPPAGTEQAPGASLFVSRLRTYMDEVAPEKVEVHLVGHSAGAIFTAHLLSRLASEQIPVTSLTWLAPAITVGEFERLVVPLLNSRNLERFSSFGLSEALELDDVVGTDRLKIYQKSLLYLVSRALEGNGETPLVGLQRHASMSTSSTQVLGNGKANFFWSPSQSPAAGRSSATSHSGMDRDMLTMTSVLLQILGTTDLKATTLFRSFTTLDALPPRLSEKAFPTEAQPINVQPAGDVPVTHMGQPQNADDTE